MPYIAAFIAPTRYTDPDAALAQVRRIYDQQINHLRDCDAALRGRREPGAAVRACYPFVRVHTTPWRAAATGTLA